LATASPRVISSEGCAAIWFLADRMGTSSPATIYVVGAREKRERERERERESNKDSYRTASLSSIKPECAP
jgi:hypothetical protein